MTHSYPLGSRSPVRDTSLRHQPVLDFRAGGIALSCNCRYSPRGGGCYEPIEVRHRWDSPAELLYIYRQHIEAGAAAA